MEDNRAESAPSYGATGTYLGREGERYFERQQTSGVLASKYNEFIFRPFVSKDDDVLDFGCGGGNLLSILNPRTKVGVEINPAARKRASQSGIAAYSSLAEIKEQTFSRVVTSHALEHVPNPYDALCQLRQVLRPDGLLLWLSPMDDCHTRRQKRWKPSDFDKHLYTWTPLLMGNLLEAAGYSPETVSIVVHACPPAVISETLWKINKPLFHLAARAWAMARRQRQIFAVASVPRPRPSFSDSQKSDYLR